MESREYPLLGAASLRHGPGIPPTKARHDGTCESSEAAVVVQGEQALWTRPCGSPASAPTSFAIAGWVIDEYRLARPHWPASWLMYGAILTFPIRWL